MATDKVKAKIKGAKGTVFSIDGIELKAGETHDLTVDQLKRLGDDAELVGEDERKGGKE